MSDQTDDAGTIQALLERLVEFRLPRALALKKRIDGGERMTDADIAFLKSALEDAHNGLRFVARTDDKRRGRLNIIRHLLDHIPYEELPRKKVKFPKRQKRGGYVEPEHPYRYLDEWY